MRYFGTKIFEILAYEGSSKCLRKMFIINKVVHEYLCVFQIKCSVTFLPY